MLHTITLKRMFLLNATSGHFAGFYSFAVQLNRNRLLPKSTKIPKRPGMATEFAIPCFKYRTNLLSQIIILKHK